MHCCYYNYKDNKESAVAEHELKDLLEGWKWIAPSLFYSAQRNWFSNSTVAVKQAWFPLVRTAAVCWVVQNEHYYLPVTNGFLKVISGQIWSKK